MKTPDQLVTASDFLEFFEAIPEEKWTTGVFMDRVERCCAGGHLGVRNSAMSNAEPYQRLNTIFGGRGYTVTINDGFPAFGNENEKEPNPFCNLPTPKARICAALRDAIAKGK